MGTLLWACLVIAGFCLLIRYAVSYEPTPTAHADQAVVEPVAMQFFVHPQCPCTAASVEQIDRLINQLSRTVPVIMTAYIATPAGEEYETWADTGIVNRLRTLPGTEVRCDPDAMTASAFGMKTSGALVIIRGGKQVFRGGLTALRGHAGDSDSCDAALRAAAGKQIGNQSRVEWPVFGCPLKNEPRPARMEMQP